MNFTITTNNFISKYVYSTIFIFFNNYLSGQTKCIWPSNYHLVQFYCSLNSLFPIPLILIWNLPSSQQQPSSCRLWPAGRRPMSWHGPTCPGIWLCMVRGQVLGTNQYILSTCSPFLVSITMERGDQLQLGHRDSVPVPPDPLYRYCAPLSGCWRGDRIWQ